MPTKPVRPAASTASSKPVKSSKPGRKPLKIIGIVIAVVIALFIITAVALPFIINPNDFKPRIAQVVKDKTGRELAIPGNIKLSIFPWLGVQIGSMQLSNASGFTGTAFASINETDVHVRFWPLLHGKIEVGTVKLDGMNLDLERDTNGRTNWQDILEHLQSGQPSLRTGGAPSNGLANLHVEGLSISDSGLRWSDAQKHQQYTIGNFNVDMGEFTPGKPVRVSTGFDFTGTNPQVTGHGEFKGSLIADLAHRIYTTDDAKLELNASGDAVPGGQVNAVLLWQHAAINLDSGTLALNGLSAEVYGLKAQVDAEGKGITKTPSITGTLKLEPFSPRQVLQALGKASLADTRDPAVLTNASASFDFVASPTSASLQNLSLKLDDTTLTGKLTVKDFASQALAFDLSLDQFNADRYLPPQKAGAPGKPREETDINKISIPVRTLRRLNLDGHLHVGQFALLGARTSDMDVTVMAHNGVVRVDPLGTQLYGGALSGNLQIDASSDTPIVTEDLSLKGVQTGGLVQDLFKTNRLSGIADMHVSLRALGPTVDEIRHTLSGRMNFDFKNGVIEGINVWDTIARAYALVKHEPAPPPAPARTQFAAMHGSASVSRGVLENRDFSAYLPFLNLSGEGKLDLVNLALDYSLKGKITGTPKLGAQEDLSGLAGATIPLRITGTLSNLSVRPDLGGAAQEKLRGELKDKAKDKLKDLLKGGGGGDGG